MLISVVQQSDSVKHIFFSIIISHRILSIVPCAIWEDLTIYPSHT